MANKVWGKWENQEQIDEGGAGHVYRVRNVETSQVGALKKLKNPNRLERFVAEIEAARKLSHPNVVQLLDANLEQEPYYAVFEYEPGGNLGNLAPHELLTLPLTQRLELCEQICAALHAAHELKLVHRDVKPDNILISQDRRTVRLCDFGLVFYEGGERQTATMEQIGSRFYIPPELEDGRADEADLTSDVYSMGKVLYYIVTGHMFAREKHREEKNDLIIRMNNPLLESISRILDKSITDDPKKRFSSMQALKDEIVKARKALLLEAPVAGIESTYRCLFCKSGTYEIIGTTGLPGDVDLHNRGYSGNNMSGAENVILECINCGNIQRFRIRRGGDEWFPREFSKLRR